MKDYDSWAELAVARLKCYPVGLVISMGTWEGTPLGLMYQVQQRTPIGLMYVKMEKEYFQSIKNNTVFKDFLAK